MHQVSIGQAAANALAAWLRQSLQPDITVLDRWAEPNEQLPPKAVTVLCLGRRRRLGAIGMSAANIAVIGNGPSARVAFQMGSVEQPMQLDAWANTNVDRDDIVAQLDAALNAGIPQTLGIAGDPVRDGLLLPLLDGYDGNNCDYVFDDPEITDTPETVQRSEYRAVYFGLASAPMIVQPADPVPLLKKPIPNIKGGTGPINNS